MFASQLEKTGALLKENELPKEGALATSNKFLLKLWLVERLKDFDTFMRLTRELQVCWLCVVRSQRDGEPLAATA